MLPAVRPHRAGASRCGDVDAAEQDAAAGRLDQLQHHLADGRLAAAGFADQAQRLAAARSSKLTPSTALHDIADCAAQQPAADREMLDEVARPRGAGRRSCGGLEHAVGYAQQADDVAGRLLDQRRRLGAAALARKARSAARRRSRRSACVSTGTMPGISCEPRPPPGRLGVDVEARDRPQQAARVGMQRPVEQLLDRSPPRPCGRHT